MINKKTRNGVLALFLLSCLFISAFFLQPAPIIIPEEIEPIPTPLLELYERINSVNEMIEDQKDIDANLLAELDSGSYSFESPLIVINPYHVSPLTAVLLFETTEPTQVKLTVHGRTEDQSLDYTFEQFETKHMLPIYGLYGDSSNLVTLTIIDQQGNLLSKDFTLTTDKIPDILSTNLFNSYRSGLPMSPGFTFSYGNGYSNFLKTGLDANGEYRWVLDMKSDLFADFQNGKNIIFTFGNTMGYMLFVEMNYLGKISNVYYSAYGCHHDLLVYDGSLLVTGSNNVPNSIEDFIYKIDLNTGEITESLDYKTILLRTRQVNKQFSNHDWMHNNSIVEYDGDVIVSSNFQSSVIRNDWDGNIKWILSEPSAYTAKYQQYLLKPIGKDFLYSFNQHAVEVLPDTDGNPDTVDIILFDNGTSRYTLDLELQRKVDAYEVVAPPLFSRMVIYRIDEKQMTVRQLWEYGQDRPELFSSARGDANLLENNNYLGLFQVKENGFEDENDHSVYLEVNPEGKVVWELVASSTNRQNVYSEYRAVRFEMYNSDSEDLDLGVLARNFIPQDLIDSAKASSERNVP